MELDLGVASCGCYYYRRASYRYFGMIFDVEESARTNCWVTLN